MNKAKELQKIAKEIENCFVCKVGKSGKAVVGEGSANAKVVFIGEAPGRTESLTGRPFVGRSGKYLRSKIYDLGFKDNDVFITSPVKYLPDKGTPSRADVEHGRVHLLKQLKIINPKIVVLLGRVAASGVLNEKVYLSKSHGSEIVRNDTIYFTTFHPAAAMRFLKIRRLFDKDFMKLKSVLTKIGIVV